MEQKSKKIKVRGTGTYDPETQKFGFEPFNEAPSTQQNVKTCAGGGKRWVTTGSDPSKMITLKSKESSADQYADFVKQFEALTKDMKPHHPLKLPDKQRVVCEEGMQVFLESKQGRLTFQGCIDLRQSLNWQSELMRLMQIIMRHLPVNKRFTTFIGKIKKGGQNHV